MVQTTESLEAKRQQSENESTRQIEETERTLIQGHHIVRKSEELERVLVIVHLLRLIAARVGFLCLCL